MYYGSLAPVTTRLCSLALAFGLPQPRGACRRVLQLAGLEFLTEDRGDLIVCNHPATLLPLSPSVVAAVVTA